MNRIPVVVAAAAAALLAVSARSRQLPEPVRPAPKAGPRIVVSAPGAPSPSAAMPASRVRPEPSLIAVPAVPAGAAEDLRLLQEWILSLSAPELRALDDAGRLNRNLAPIVAELARRSAAELDRFLTQLNARLGAIPP